MQSMKVLRNPTLWGAGALVIVVVGALVAGFLYISPPGAKTVTFYTQDAASIRPGDEVRIAGIHVGKVKDLSLEADRVRVRARVEDDAFVGDQSQVEVRMLTVVGGYYVNVVSLGDRALGTKPIPLERVTMPYNLMRTITDATKITEHVKPKPINEALNQVQKGLSGTNVETISAVIDAGNGLMSTIDKQRGQITKILGLSDEYIRTLNESSDKLRSVVRKLAIIEQELDIYGKGLSDSIAGLGEILDSVSPIVPLYMDDREKFLRKVRDLEEKSRFWSERNGVIIRALRLGRNKIERVLDAQHAPPELLATDLCVPLPGGPCS
jgi:phospholipid/cholesterol/gamma-HCH transport system substrate-binding protein